jgi:hypothetical protein
MHLSTISKVQFFAHVIKQMLKGKLKTASKECANRIDRLLESRTSRLVAFGLTVLSLGSWLAFFAVKARAFF